jgi:ketosteroid isomerase-like protein
MDLDRTIEQLRAAMVQFAKGDSKPVEDLCSHADDVILANPFGSTAVGWADVRDALRYAASNFRDGNVTGVDKLGTFAAEDVVTVFEIERWEARVGDRADIAPFELRVSTTWRLEDGAWKMVLRHADPIRTLDAAGPLRAT